MGRMHLSRNDASFAGKYGMGMDTRLSSAHAPSLITCTPASTNRRGFPLYCPGRMARLVSSSQRSSPSPARSRKMWMPPRRCGKSRRSCATSKRTPAMKIAAAARQRKTLRKIPAQRADDRQYKERAGSDAQTDDDEPERRRMGDADGRLFHGSSSSLVSCGPARQARICP